MTVEFKPTRSQIAGGYLVIPQKFVSANDYAINWAAFTAVAFGVAHPGRSLDQCNRLRVATKGKIEPGQTLRASLDGDTLKIEVA